MTLQQGTSSHKTGFRGIEALVGGCQHGTRMAYSPKLCYGDATVPNC